MWGKGGFLFPSTHTILASATSPPPTAPVPAVPPNAFARIKVFDGDGDGDGGPCIWPVVYDDSLSIPTTFGITSVYTEEVVAPTHHSTPPPVHLLSHHRSPFRGKGEAKDLE